jgi:hypothetical protein
MPNAVNGIPGSNKAFWLVPAGANLRQVISTHSTFGQTINSGRLMCVPVTISVHPTRSPFETEHLPCSQYPLVWKIPPERG